MSCCAGFRSPDDGIRRFWDVAALARKHHGDDSLARRNWRFFTWPSALLSAATQKAVWMMVRAYRIAARRAMSLAVEYSRIWLKPMASWQCDACRAAECAEFADKALVHAAAMPPARNQVADACDPAADSGAAL